MTHRTTLALLAASALLLPAHAQTITELWNTSCANCHGQQGQGGGAGTSSLLTSELSDYVTGIDTDRRFFDAIKNGMPEQGMPAFGPTLSDQKIWALVVHARELQAQHYRSTNPPPRPADAVYSTSLLSFRLQRVVTSGLDVPWSVEFVPATLSTSAATIAPPPGSILITERPGTIRILHQGKLSKPVAGTPAVRNRGQGGLMDITLHPDFADNAWVYIAFSDELSRRNQSLGFTSVVRGRITPQPDGSFAWTDQQPIFAAKPEHYTSGDIHFGCKIVFAPAPDNRHYVFFAIGERGRGDLAQDLARPNGKVFRLFDDGSIPSDNPFTSIPDAYHAIWSFGHRNPQGLSFDLQGRLWDTEHGPRGGDELNLIAPARNYGWPRVSFGINYNDSSFATPWPQKPLAATDPSTDGLVMPAFRWLPSIGACGLTVVAAAKDSHFAPWNGDLLAGGLSGSNVDRLRLSDAGAVTQHEPILRGIGRVRDVAQAPDGSIYVVLNQPDHLIRLTPPPASPK
jgi:aldose sugar dehydrogenase